MYEGNKLYLKNLNPQYGTFVNFTEGTLSTKEKEMDLMINNHIVELKSEEAESCFFNNIVRIKLQE